MKYYAQRPTWLNVIMNFLLITTWCGTIYGFAKFYELNLMYWFLFGPLLVVLTASCFASSFVCLFYKKFDIQKHESFVNEFWKKKFNPKIDVMLPVCGEPIYILEKTWNGVKDIRYKNKEVYVLDDKGDYEVKKLAQKFGFNYLSRQDKGYMKKAGNLNYGLKHSNGEFFIIFDADFVPKPEFIHELLPYMQNSRTAIVQSPQYFELSKEVYKRSRLEYGAGASQEEFYNIIQVARDYFEGAICVGSNALYRRSALDEIDGIELIEHSEDMWTGFKLSLRGYKVKYVPVILATGLCPNKLVSFFKQQVRWCSGSMSMLLSKLFWKSRIPFMQRLCYMCGMLYYLDQFVLVLLPLQLLVLNSKYFNGANLFASSPFIPGLIVIFMIYPLLKNYKPRMSNLFISSISTYSYFYGVVINLLGKQVAWVPSGQKQNKSNDFSKLTMFILVYFIIFLTAILLRIFADDFTFGINNAFITFWFLYQLLFLEVLCVNMIRARYETSGIHKEMNLNEAMDEFSRLSKLRTQKLVNKIAI